MRNAEFRMQNAESRIQNAESRIQNALGKGTGIMRETANTFEDLVVWQQAHQFVLEVYHFTRSFPKSEMFGLTSQFRRAALSIPANVAEGFKRRGPKDKLRFFNVCPRALLRSAGTT